MKKNTSLDDQWSAVLSLLPRDIDESAFRCRALVRKRGVQSASSLLRVALAYGVIGLSLRETSAWAKEKGVAQISDVALLNRLRGSGDWLQNILAELLAQRTSAVVSGQSGLRIRLVDATTISCPGSPSADWRIHMGFSLSDMRIDHVELTPTSTAETLRLYPVEKGEVLVADRGYAHRRGFHAVVSSGGDLVVRIPWKNVPLVHPDGTPFDILENLRGLKAGEVAEFEVATASVPDQHLPQIPGRLLAVRKSDEAVQRALKNVKRCASRNQFKTDPRTNEACEYIILFTTLTSNKMPAAEVMELYRLRWQIEIAFKRLKSILKLDEMVAKDIALCRTFLLAKLIAALLIDDLTNRASLFSPWGYGTPRTTLVMEALASDN
jgi:IS4 transposase